MMSLTVELPEEQVRLIEAQVASGAYASASEVVSAGVSELEAAAVIGDTSDEWVAFCERVRETARKLDAGTEPLLTLEEVRERLRLRRAAAAG